jgi:uncharacterized protein YneF (UPF0154 family)
MKELLIIAGVLVAIGLGIIGGIVWILWMYKSDIDKEIPDEDQS